MRTLTIAIVASACVTASTAQRRVYDYTVTDLGDAGNVNAILAFNSAASMLVTEVIVVGGQPTVIPSLLRFTARG